MLGHDGRVTDVAAASAIKIPTSNTFSPRRFFLTAQGLVFAMN